MGREDLRTIGFIGFAATAALGIYVLAEGIGYTDPAGADPLSNIITIVGIALIVLAVAGAATVLLAYRAHSE